MARWHQGKRGGAYLIRTGDSTTAITGPGEHGGARGTEPS